MDKEVEWISSDYCNSSQSYEINLKHDSEIKTKSKINSMGLLLNENETVNGIRTFTKQNRIVHVLSDSEDSDNSSNKLKSNENGQSCKTHVLSDSEDSDSNIKSVTHRVGVLKHKRDNGAFSRNALRREEYQEFNDLVAHGQNFPEKNRRQTERKRSNNAEAKEERLRKKEEEVKKRAERQAALELQKQLKPGECMKYMKVVLDSALLDCPFGGELLTSIQNMDCEYLFNVDAIPLSITWQHQFPDSNCTEEAQMLLVWQWEQFVRAVQDRTLCDNVSSIQQKIPNKIITLVVFSVDGYFSYLKNKRRKSQTSKGCKGITSVTRAEMDLVLTELQIQLNCNHRLVSKGQELGLLISQFTKSIAETPFKKEKQKREQDTLHWFAVGDSRDCVRIDKDGNGLTRLWQQQLCQFNLAGVDTAQAIAAVYPSPQVLVQAYDKCDTRKEGELLLQNIPVRRSQGLLAPARRIGPELSKKIYLFFNNTDGDCPLSQE